MKSAKLSMQQGKGIEHLGWILNFLNIIIREGCIGNILMRVGGLHLKENNQIFLGIDA
jgi:hypothetical protein